MAESAFGLIFLLLYCLTAIEGQIRCYCNEAGCVTTGYMCKSNLGTCYSLVTYLGDTMDAVHGCADSLPELKQKICVENHPKEFKDEPRTNDIVENEPAVLCCTEDMCNYQHHLDIGNLVIDTQSNESTKRGDSQIPGSTLENQSLSSKNTFTDKNPEKDLWFKAAVIAVPIAGGFILILLVLLAVRMLRSDSRHHRRLIQIRRERSLTKAQLYVTDHFIDKSDTSRGLYGNKPHLHRDPKVMIDKDGNRYEQVSPDRNSDKIPHNKKTSYPSIIVWGKSKKSDPATVV